jgi:hypothetical protein
MADAILNQIKQINVDNLYSWLDQEGNEMLFSAAQRVTETYQHMLFLSQGDVTDEALQAKSNVEELEKALSVIALVKFHIETRQG